ncbi:type II CRISPR RNA-guided endonuclease Cas9 [uncultured Helicobacter sp.]|uniref:type II CRISPR RNA-guided endonuclease Cas9 n=4 Tax=uncultured Helicobacter sp. TaxID=175537 RepID=UPI0025F55655|nr:type II CRISPR RNA-guided endonuclease Cas9 [uncultured Helicobacter sp.]
MKVLGFDIGITSIGWAYVEGNELQDCGVRIFTQAENPKTGAPLALPRREARSTRRRLARRKGRLYALKQLICKEFGLNVDDYLSDDGDLPKAYINTKDTKSPYELRTLALTQRLEHKDLARVILHIAKHRGYGNKHAREMDNAKQSENGKIKAAIEANKRILDEKGYKSVGEYLYKTFYQQERSDSEKKGSTNSKEFQNVRNRGEGYYQRCVAQSELKAELELILHTQNTLGVRLAENFCQKIIDIAFYQRELKDFSDKVGKCVFYEEENRAAKNTLSAMEFIVLTRIINTLQSISKQSGEVYGKDMITQILHIVLEKGEINYKALREILQLPESMRFPKDSKLDYTKELSVAEKAAFIEFKNFKAFKKALSGSFDGLLRMDLDEIATYITLIKDKIKLKSALERYALADTQKESLSTLSFAGHINLSLKALEQILPFMREGLKYDEAVRQAGLKEWRKRAQKDNLLSPLNEYEPYLANPVVARAMSEYRKVLNSLLKKYGQMHKIHIEFTREVGRSFKERNNIIKEQREQFAKNEKAKKQCEILGLPLSAINILKVKLWLEQGEFCVYSGEKITRAHLLNSQILQIDHIYPYSRSFDDSYLNKVLCFTKENQNKHNKTPFEAFGGDTKKWEQIKSYSLKLPKPKQRRICNEHFVEKESGFIPRNLNDTSYIARLCANWTKDCLEFLPLSESEVTISGEKGSKVHIEVVSGNLTAMLRHYWGLGEKDRDNHLHHAFDAIIIAFSNAKMIKAFSDFKKQRELNRARFYAKEMAEADYKKQKVFFEPMAYFRERVLAKVDSIFVSKPPRKRARRALHEETFYSFGDKALMKQYGGQKGIEKAIALGKIRRIGTKIVKNGNMVRVDIFKHKQNGKFYGVPIYTMDFALGILPNKAVVSGKDKEEVIKDWLEMDNSYEFCFSLFKDDLILVQKKDMEKAELCYFVSFDSALAQIQVEKHNNKLEGLSDNEKLLYTNATKEKVVGKSIGIQNLKIFEKYQVSSLGEVQKADFTPRQNIALKLSPKYKKRG